jgi:hypothetical protein
MASEIPDEKLRFPIGKFKLPESTSADQIREQSDIISTLPEKLRKLTESLNSEDLDRTYRPGSWNVRQLVHHIADSHMNAFIRFKLALTEDVPAIKPYFEDLWAELPDSSGAPVSHSISLIEGLHARWAHLLNSMSESDFNKKLHHPEHKKNFRLYEMLSLYAWHSEHHLAHIRIAINK